MVSTARRRPEEASARAREGGPAGGPLFDWISHSRNNAFHCLISSETFILHPSIDAAAANAATGELSQALSDVINACIITLLLLDCLG